MGEYYPVFLFLSERSLVLGDLRRLIMKAFGEKVRQLREERGISREAFCGDETESVSYTPLTLTTILRV